MPVPQPEVAAPAQIPGPSGGGGFTKWLAIGGVCTVVGLLGLIGYLVLSGDDQQADPPTSAPIEATQPPTTVPETIESETIDSPSTAPSGGNSDDLTTKQKEAASAARDMLAYRAYSRLGLIAYLADDPYQGTFTEDDSVVAVDSLGVDWDEQATRSAESYLEILTYSRLGLIDQLEDDLFTSDQATQAVNALDVDWIDQAKREAQEYAEDTATSRPAALQWLTEYQLFETDEAEQGVDAANIDWNAEAAEAAAKMVKYSERDLTCDDIIDRLSGEYGDDFTVEQATYGAGTTDAC